jgi:acyl-CoA synthetase (AMP-forming)/AMP-acid ligase II
MIIAELPTVVFLDERGGQTLRLDRCGRQIAHLSDLIQARMPSARRVGILFRSTPELVLYWLAVLDSGKTPLILQYPTKKLSLDYWQNTLANTIAMLAIDGIVCGPELQDAPSGLATLLIHEGGCPEADRECVSIDPVSVLQMSSGTTGMRKGIEFAWDDLKRHVAIYNEVMKLTPDDRIVSWLPLYHDMGFIAAFAMPLLLGVPIVMIDPITWVENRDLLFEAIREYRGTICYMPNFGFEVMSRARCSPDDLASMRLWISCSEPTYRASVERFCSATETPADRIAVCYAMAENIFAISQRSGLRTTQKGEQEVVSCGFALPDTDLKIVDGQVWARSPTSIANYVGGESILDDKGFYPTGDMGFFEDGELYLEGRRHDLLVQAGRKFFLNDFDYLLNEVDPSCRGHGAALALHDKRLGTEKLVFLVERDDFYNRQARALLHNTLAAALPIEDFEVHFVPTGFITKTSSGKINRVKTVADFERIGTCRAAGPVRLGLDKRLDEIFPFTDRARPLAEVVDSLGLVMASLAAQEYGLAFDSSMSIGDLLSIDRGANSIKDQASEEVISLVAVFDPISNGFSLAEADIIEISKTMGIKVIYEHVCLPPAYFLWQDIVFRDYFLPRDVNEKYDEFIATTSKLDNASLILFDDFTEFQLGACAFPVLDRQFRRTALADLLAIRFQKHSRRHHELPVGDVVLGKTVSAEQRATAFRAIGEYLNIPIFRAAFLSRHAAETRDWEYTDYNSESEGERRQRFISGLTDFLRTNIEAIPRKRVAAGTATQFVSDDLAHFCSFVVNPNLIERVVTRFDAFVIQGFPNSVPLLARRIRETGKRLIFVPTLQPDGTIGPLGPEFSNACIVQTGAWRECVTDLPVIRIMHGNGIDSKNLPNDFELPFSSGLTEAAASTIRYVTDPLVLESLRAAQEVDFAQMTGGPAWLGREELTPWPPWADTLDGAASGLWQRCASAWILFKRGLYDEARSHFEWVRTKTERRHGLLWLSASHGMLLCLVKRQGMREASKIAYDMLPWAPPLATPFWQEIYALAADAETALGRSQTAVAFLERILEVDPENSAALNSRLSAAEAMSSRLRSHA